MKSNFLVSLALLLSLAGCQLFGGNSKYTDTVQIDNDVDAALSNLYVTSPVAKKLAKSAKGILIFPGVVKAGFIGGAQFGVGALRKHGRTAGYYNFVAGSYGLQAGVQSFNYAMLFMNDSSMDYLDTDAGLEI